MTDCWCRACPSCCRHWGNCQKGRWRRSVSTQRPSSWACMAACTRCRGASLWLDYQGHDRLLAAFAGSLCGDDPEELGQAQALHAAGHKHVLAERPGGLAAASVRLQAAMQVAEPFGTEDWAVRIRLLYAWVAALRGQLTQALPIQQGSGRKRPGLQARSGRCPGHASAPTAHACTTSPACRARSGATRPAVRSRLAEGRLKSLAFIPPSVRI
jgi:hypothetical protein